MAKQQSLASQAGATEFKMPAVFQQPQEALKSRFLAPYITFAHPKRADEWAKIVSKFGTISEGSMFLLNQNDVVKLDPLKCSLLCYRQYWGEVSAAGELLRASFKEQPKPFKEHIEAVLLVYLEDRVTPANVQFRSTKCAACHTLASALVEAGRPDWAEKSPQHKETLAVQQPFARFYGTVTLAPTRTSRQSGMPYTPTRCAVSPTGPAEWRLLDTFSKDPEATKLLDDAANRFEARVAEVKSKEK